MHEIASWSNRTFSEDVKGTLRWDLYKLMHNPYENAPTEVVAKYTFFGIGIATGAGGINYLAVTRPTIYIHTMEAIGGAFMNDTLPYTGWGIGGYAVNYTIDGIIHNWREEPVCPVDSRVAPKIITL